MKSRSICHFCGKQSGNYKYCYVCKEAICRSCSKYGICLKHYNVLSNAQKKKMKLNYASYIAFGIVPAILITIFITLYPFLNQNFNNFIDDKFKSEPILAVVGIGLLIDLILVVIIGVYLISMMFLKDKKAHKILNLKEEKNNWFSII